MSIKINLYQERRRENTNYGRVYGRVKNAQPIDIDGLAGHMAEHNTPYSKGVIKGILTDMASCIKELMLLGQPVKLADLGIFYASAESAGAPSAKEFDLGTHIKSVKLLCRATGKLMRKQLTADAALEYTDLAQKVREGKVDIGALYDEVTPVQEDGDGGTGGEDNPGSVRP